MTMIVNNAIGALGPAIISIAFYAAAISGFVIVGKELVDYGTCVDIS